MFDFIIGEDFVNLDSHTQKDAEAIAVDTAENEELDDSSQDRSFLSQTATINSPQQSVKQSKLPCVFLGINVFLLFNVTSIISSLGKLVFGLD